MFTLPKLNYEFSALEPTIDAKTMEIHYTKHHQAYLDKMNGALPQVLEAEPKFEGQPIETILCNLDQVPEAVRPVVRNHGGGHYNHSLFWESLSPNGGGEPTGELANAIKKEFGLMADFQTKFAEAGAAQFGSGWVWLIKKADQSLAIVSTPNQDNPIMNDKTVTPLLGVDVWEHAYYLNYQNRRPDYLKAIWNVINWKEIESRHARQTK